MVKARFSVWSAGSAGLMALLLGATAAPAAAQRPGPMEPGVLRVCADPDNLPSSDSSGNGLENKLAELMAQSWNSKLQYVWWAAPRGLFTRALNGRYCDIVLQAPAGFDLAGVTRPYFRTSYVIVQRRDAPHKVTGLDDPALKTMRIGVHIFPGDGENSPPAMALSAHGVVGNLVGFGTTYTGTLERPEDIIRAVVDGKVDVAMVWGPIAGYHAKRIGADLLLTPVLDDTLTRIPFTYSMGMATRRRDREFRDSVQSFIEAKHSEIQALLEQFGVPLLPLPVDSAERSTPGGPAR